MAQLTVAQRRERQYARFTEEYTHNIDETYRILNSYYRFLGLNDRLNELENDSYWHDKRYTIEQGEKFDRWHDRLNGWLKPYGLKLFRPWSTYFIEEVDSEGNSHRTAVEPIFYR